MVQPVSIAILCVSPGARKRHLSAAICLIPLRCSLCTRRHQPLNNESKIGILQDIAQRIVAPILTLIFIMGCATSPPASRMVMEITEIEYRLNARVGVAIFDEETGNSWLYNSENRFPMTSTVKTLACGALLHNVDSGTEQLNRRVTIEEHDLVTYSPILQDRTGPAGFTLKEACEATLSTSDNTAAVVAP